MQFKPLLKKFFHSGHIELRDTSFKKYCFDLQKSRQFFTCSLKDVTRWLLRKKEIPFFRGNGRQPGRGFDALAQVLGRTPFPFLRKCFVPDAKHMGDGSLEFAAPESAEIVSGRTKFKTAAKSVKRQISKKKQLISGSRKRAATRGIQTKSSKWTSWARRDIFTNTSQKSSQ